MQNSFDQGTAGKHMLCTHGFIWTPVVIGALAAVGLGFLLDVFAKGIGLALYTNNVDGAMTLAIGGFLGLAIGGFACMFFSGFMAGYFAGPMGKKGTKNWGCAYGFMAWCLSLVLVGAFASSFAGYNASRYDTRTVMTSNEVATTTQNVANRIHPATDVTDSQAEKNVRATGLASLAVFILFFIGALAATWGGHSGANCWEKCEREQIR